MERFGGFPKEGLAFLRDLAQRQNRDWFTEHRAVYDTALQGPMTDLVLDLTEELARRGVPLRGDPKRTIFRIHRDVRFSKDKSPYKTHIGATLTTDGAKLSFGVLYIHIDPKGSFTACGFYQPDPTDLDKLRQTLADDPEEWRAVAAALASSGLAVETDESALKKVPRGFDGVMDPDLQEMLKRRSWIVRKPLHPGLIADRALVDAVADFAASAMPLLRFGLEATGRD